MAEPIFELYQQIRVSFPLMARLADQQYKYTWDELDDVMVHSWFDSLANALNSEMVRGVAAEEHAALFDFLSSAFESGDEEVRGAIDVAFVENLFWQVSAESAAPYWHRLPANLQQLYRSFHGKEPV